MSRPDTDATSPPVKTRRRWRARHYIGLAVLLLVIALIAARLYLPIWLKDYVNAQLRNIPNYQGKVEAIDVRLYRGAYVIHALTLNRLNAGIPVPFLAVDTVDISLQWAALFDGRVVADIVLNRPILNFATGRSGAKQTGRETNWNEPIKKLVPIDINRIELHRGKVSYRDFESSPPVNIFIDSLEGLITNLRNTEDKNVALPATIGFTGTSIGDGKLDVKGKINILTPVIDMDMDAKLEGAKLPAFNSFSNAYIALDFKGGTMDFYTEFKVQKGNLQGYVKPIVRDLSVDRVPKNANPLEVLWASAASVVIEVFTNQPHDQFATKVPISGKLGGVESEFWPTLGGIIRNAFVQAFSKGTDNEIQFGKPAMREKD